MKVCGKSIGSRKCAQDKASGPTKRTILVAGMGHISGGADGIGV